MIQEINPKFIFIGTPEFGAIVLEKLAENNLKPVLVVTAPSKPVGRKQIVTPPPVKVAAEKHKIPVLQPKKIKDIEPRLKELNPDLIFVSAYGQILPKGILDIPKYGCLNLHPSLLPRWRGASPIQFTILSGDRTAGATIILMDEKVDHGPIVASLEFEISNLEIKYKELESLLANVGAELFIENISRWLAGEIEAREQDEDKTTYSIILKKDDGRIDWTKSAQEIARQVRAFGSWPGSFCYWPENGKKIRIKILETNILPQTNNGPFGIKGKTFQAPNNRIAVQTGKDFLVIEKLQPEGKNSQKAEDFLRGHPDFIGTILE